VNILRRINLAVEDGEFMVLVGPSGCGKSTLLRLIAGLEELTGGNICVGDRCELPPRERDIAMVFQNYALYPLLLTVYDLWTATEGSGGGRGQNLHQHSNHYTDGLRICWWGRLSQNSTILLENEQLTSRVRTVAESVTN